LPQGMLPKVSNVSDFSKALVLDTFLAQADSRQVIFVRERSKAKLSFCAYVIDHGMALGGSSWQLRDLNSQGLYFDRRIYSMTDTFSVCEHACAVLAALTEDELYRAAKDVPALWFAPGDYDALTELFTKLQRRKARLRTLVMEKLDTLRSSRSLTLVDFALSKKSACIDSADVGNLVNKPAILPVVT
jgi:hypothetical protein